MPIDDHTKTDEELVHASLSDKEQFGLLAERYAEKLRSYMRRLGVQGPEDREDIVQETFMKVYEHLNGFDTDLSFSSWMYRIAHNQAMSFFRKRRVRPEGHLTELEDGDFDLFRDDADLFSDIAQSHDALRVRAVLIQLPQQEYEIILLRFFEHKSYDEISDILTLPPGTVANRLSRAKARIKRIMTTNGFTYA